MHFLLKISAIIDTLNEKVGQAVSWLLLADVLICTGNAVYLYLFKQSSNAWLEIQWYLFAAIFLLGAATTLKRNEHIRIDIVASRFSQRTQVWIDVFGFIFFLLPMTILVVYLALPYALESIHNQEVSNNAGGLIVWPAKLLIPTGFFLLSLQGISELIKRIGYLCGLVDAASFEKQAHGAQVEVDTVNSGHPSSQEN